MTSSRRNGATGTPALNAGPEFHQQLLTESAAAKWLSVSARTLWSLRDSGKIDFIRIGRSVRYDVDDLRAFVVNNKSNAGS